MKKATKAFLIIGLILSFALLPFSADYFLSEDFVIGIFILINGIDDIIISLISFNKINKARKRKELIALGVISIIFANPVAGCLMLCIRDEDLVESNSDPLQNNQAKPTPEEITDILEQPLETVEENSIESKNRENKTTLSVDPQKITRERALERLDDLKLLKERGLITEEEYVEKSKKYVEIILQ